MNKMCEECPFRMKTKLGVNYVNYLRYKKDITTPRACHMKEKGWKATSEDNECIGHKKIINGEK